MAASLSSALRLRRLLLALPRNDVAFQSFEARSFTSGEPRSDVSSLGIPMNGGKESGSWSKFLLFLPGGITFGLGTWQIIRRREKIEMIEHRQKRLEMEPIMWRKFKSLDEDLGSLEFRKVECEGVFDEGKSIYVGPRSRSISGLTENGYFLITPLIPAGNDPESVQMPILVNRGWVPKEWRNSSRNTVRNGGEKLSLPSTEDSVKSKSHWWKFWSRKTEPAQQQDRAENLVKVLGVIRGSENPSIFVPANDAETGQWFYIDVPSMAHSSGLPDHTIYIEDINEKKNAINPYPVPRDANSLIRSSVMPQDHLNYTFTWYALSAAVTFMAAKRVRMTKGRR